MEKETNDNYQIELCKFYLTSGFPNFKPRCSQGFKAGLHCHSRDTKCKGYKPTAK